MKLIKYLTALLAMMILAVSCGKEKPDVKPVEKTPEIKVTPSEASISAAGGSATLSLFANMDWNVKDVPSWLTVSPESGEGSNYKQTITLSAEANSGGMKEATLTFSIDGATASVKVKQNHGFSSDAPSNALFFESFTKSKGNFTIKDIDVPSQLPFIWEFSADYKCMKATAYHNASAKNYASESWLISPSIDLPAGTKAYFTFEHAGGYFGKATEEATVWISKNEGDWEQLEIDPKAYPTSWTFISAGNWDMTPYAGSTVQIAFRYSSTATKAGTWEVRNVAILSGQHEDTVIPNVDPKKTDWMELPAMDNDAYGYYSHSFSMKDKVYRNYSFAWSQKDLVSVWMAYPLCKTYTEKGVNRTDAWNYDPILGPELSCAPFSGYAGEDYDRGHQVPSADRLCCKDANEQTFYGTNIIPQMKAHNEGIWQNLENRIREIANASDTTYVVTGCVVDGSKEITTDSDGKTMTVPVAFFKAVLRYKKGDANVWTAAGFYTDHKNYGGSNANLKAVSMSIDELEEKTGHDFFVNLAGKIGSDEAAAVEAQKPGEYKVWGL